MTDKLVYTPEEARLLLGLGRASIYGALRAGAIPSIRVGRKYLIPVQALHRRLDQAGQGAPATPDGNTSTRGNQA